MMKWFLIGSALANVPPSRPIEYLTGNDIRYTVEQAEYLASIGKPVPDNVVRGHSIKNGKAAMHYSLWNLDHNEATDRYTVRYTFDESAGFTESQKDYVASSLLQLSNDICIDFVYVAIPGTNDFNKGVIKYIDDSGCWSSIGRGSAAHSTGQEISLKISAGCVNQGVIVHEMMHALGFHHEQTRSDRDDYAIIQEANVEEGMMHNFNMLSEFQHNLMTESPYDFYSVMHYGAYFFTTNGQPTITGLDGNVILTQQYRPSSMDVYQLCKLYSCSTCAGETNYLSTDGVTLPKMHKCTGMVPDRYFWASRCNDGWTECRLNNDDEIGDECPRPPIKECCARIHLSHPANPQGVNGEYVRKDETFNNAPYYFNAENNLYLYQYIGNSNWHISAVLDNAMPIYWHLSSGDGECPEEGSNWQYFSENLNDWSHDTAIHFECIIPTTSATSTSMTTPGPTEPPGNCCKCFQFIIEGDSSWNLEFCYTGEFYNGVPVFRNEYSGFLIYQYEGNNNWHLNSVLGDHRAYFYASSNGGVIDCPTDTGVWYAARGGEWIAEEGVSLACHHSCCEYIRFQHPVGFGANGFYALTTSLMHNKPVYYSHETGYYIYTAGDNNWHVTQVLGSSDALWWSIPVDCPQDSDKWWYLNENNQWTENTVQVFCVDATTPLYTTSPLPTTPDEDCCPFVRLHYPVYDANGVYYDATDEWGEIAGYPVYYNAETDYFIYVYEVNIKNWSIKKWHVSQLLGSPEAIFWQLAANAPCPTDGDEWFYFSENDSNWMPASSLMLFCVDEPTTTSPLTTVQSTTPAQDCSGWSIKNKKKTTLHLESQHSKIFRYQMNETPDNKDYIIFVTFLKKNCGQDFMDSLYSGKVMYEAFDKEVVYIVNDRYSYMDNNAITIQFHSNGLQGSDNLGNSLKDVFYFEVSGIDQVDWKKKDPNKCLKWVKVGYRDQFEFESIENWAKCYHENYLSIKRWFKG